MKRCILFVDDEPAFLDGLRRSLHGYEDVWDMSFARSATEALEVVAVVEFDAIVLDVNMPDQDGFALLTVLRRSERTRDIPVVVLTGRDDRGIKRRALDLGAADLLTKPVEGEDLEARLRSVLRLKAYQDALKAQKRSLEVHVKERTVQLESSRREILWRLGKAGEYRDEATGNHVYRVGCYCRAVAEALRAPSEFAETVFLTSPLHDIGKIGVPDWVLLKPGRLAPGEARIMKRHCEIGERILLDDVGATRLMRSGDGPDRKGDPRPVVNPLLRMAATIALSHHERWDGTGYPAGLEAEAIPLEARIVAVADTYDALRTKRPYKPAFSEARALDIIAREAGRHFDPHVHAAFLEVAETCGAILQSLTGEQGPVPWEVSPHEANPVR